MRDLLSKKGLQCDACVTKQDYVRRVTSAFAAGEHYFESSPPPRDNTQWRDGLNAVGCLARALRLHRWGWTRAARARGLFGHATRRVGTGVLCARSWQGQGRQGWQASRSTPWQEEEVSRQEVHEGEAESRAGGEGSRGGAGRRPANEPQGLRGEGSARSPDWCMAPAPACARCALPRRATQATRCHPARRRS